MAKRDQVLEATRAIGRPCTIKEITTWLERHHPGHLAHHRVHTSRQPA